MSKYRNNQQTGRELFLNRNRGFARQEPKITGGRKARKIRIDGISKTIPEWAEFLEVRPALIYQRICKGWTEEEAICTPKMRKTTKMFYSEDDLPV